MSAKPYQGTEQGPKQTQSPGNANGKPIVPVLLGVVAVIALILITLSVSRRSQNVNAGTSESGPIPVVQYSPAGISDIAVGQRSRGMSDTASRPATAPLNSSTPSETSTYGSSSLPGTAPSSTGMSKGQSAGQNVVAPPGPAANGQGNNR